MDAVHRHTGAGSPDRIAAHPDLTAYGILAGYGNGVAPSSIWTATTLRYLLNGRTDACRAGRLQTALKLHGSARMPRTCNALRTTRGATSPANAGGNATRRLDHRRTTQDGRQKGGTADYLTFHRTTLTLPAAAACAPRRGAAARHFQALRKHRINAKRAKGRA